MLRAMVSRSVSDLDAPAPCKPSSTASPPASWCFDAQGLIDIVNPGAARILRSAYRGRFLPMFPGCGTSPKPRAERFELYASDPPGRAPAMARGI